MLQPLMRWPAGTRRRCHRGFQFATLVSSAKGEIPLLETSLPATPRRLLGGEMPAPERDLKRGH